MQAVSKQLKRTNAYNLLLQEDHLLQMHLGYGLAGFMGEEAKASEKEQAWSAASRCFVWWSLEFTCIYIHLCPTDDLVMREATVSSRLSRPTLVLVQDSASVNCCAAAFSLHVLKLRMMWVPDPWHMVWNATQNAAKQCGLWSSVLLSTTCLNAAYGPWNGAKWFCSIREAAEEKVALARSDDPIFAALKPRILVERNVESIDVKEALSNCDFLRKKQPSVEPWLLCLRFGCIHKLIGSGARGDLAVVVLDEVHGAFVWSMSGM